MDPNPVQAFHVELAQYADQICAQVFERALPTVRYAQYDATGAYGLVYVGARYPDTERNAHRVLVEAENWVAQRQAVDALPPALPLTDEDKKQLLQHFATSYLDFENDTLDDWARRHGYTDRHVDWLWDHVP